ncbi:hypothetical protein BC939DRAFT_443340 [Gamsiella multidivaricata]|uniref:uncharacterized protein n=1 Tax=Gamsiella multidivaricata TaxID=101098 RepID=UPI0022212198|nr:uncharacterized protein BC939DRAFT_443340 [Gamsiella multidivaricata]KAG0369689.1 hypothetical protein BGZ54_009179 [Gamsiella multidivaricata]KAI7828589.1 hypothetical protein BC939DRAFT_443340 [Gamsiella multidivaricata]
MNISLSLSLDANTSPVSPSPFLTFPSQEQPAPSPPSSPFTDSNAMSPQVSTVLSSPPPSPELPKFKSDSQPTPTAAYSMQRRSDPQCLAEQRLRASFAQHQEYQQQMRKRLSQADHPLHLPSPESAQLHHQYLVAQLEYYRQLQIMHCQRVRDIELLHLQQQQQQQQQQQPQPLHVIKRFQLAQRMVQMQQLYHAQQIQNIQYLQKINRLQLQPVSTAESEQRPAQGIDPVSEEDIAKLEIDPNTIHIPVRGTSQPRLDLQEIFGAAGNMNQSSATRGRSRIQELARITLPCPAQIRKLRHLRLKYQARLRQAVAATKTTKALHTHQPCATMNAAEGASQMTRSNSTTTTIVPLSPDADQAAQLAKQIQTTVWTSSTTTVVPRTAADLRYKRQLRHSMALQQHMIQDHTHRYRIFQAFCLLQRTREAQAMDEAQTHQRRQLQTLAWVEALRNSKELEIPQ